MNNPYVKVFENFSKAITKLNDMIVWIAKRTLSVKEYMEFVDEFTKKKSDDMESILTELLKDEE